MQRTLLSRLILGVIWENIWGKKRENESPQLRMLPNTYSLLVVSFLVIYLPSPPVPSRVIISPKFKLWSYLLCSTWTMVRDQWMFPEWIKSLDSMWPACYVRLLVLSWISMWGCEMWRCVVDSYHHFREAPSLSMGGSEVYLNPKKTHNVSVENPPCDKRTLLVIRDTCWVFSSS